MEEDVKLNFNDVKILTSIFDKKDMTGFTKSKGTTVAELHEKTNFSLSKIRKTLNKFKSMGWIAEGLKDVSVKTYYVTSVGFEGLNELTNTDIDLNNLF